MDVTHYRRLLRDCFAGRLLVLVGVSRARQLPVADGLPSLGARAVFALSCSADGDEPPEHPDIRWWSFAFTGRDHQELDGRFEAALREPPENLLRALDDFDPRHEALVLDSRDLPGTTFAGRRRFGWRRPAWASVEDKIAVEEVWREAGIRHAPSLIVAARAEAVAEVAGRLDAGAGTVWAADARDGLHAGAEGTRWVRDDEQAAAAMAMLFPRCDRIRIMPFLEGLPCSIHGLVCSGGMVALRPLELLTLRRPDGEFAFAGTSTVWDCPEDAAKEIREATRRVGTALRQLVGYRGGFTVDGVLTSSGFLPTEVNARLGSGLNINQTRPELQFFLLNRLVQEHATLDVRPAYLEELVNEALEETRDGQARISLRRPAERSVSVPVRRGDRGEWVAAGEPSAVEAIVTVEPSDRGDQANFIPSAVAFLGAALAPLAVTAFAYAERTLGVHVGPIAAAAEVT